MSQAELKATFEELGYPGVLKFRAGLKKRGIEGVSYTKAKEFVDTYSQRQVLAKENKYNGKIISSQLNGRWAADFISYVSQPAGEFKHILAVQDIFSRMIYTEATKSVQAEETVAAFKRILAKASEPPIELNTDRGGEFGAEVFQKMLKEKKILFRVAEAKNDIATLDRAIATLKATLTRLVVTPGNGNWADELQRATKAHNKNAHTHLKGGSPVDVEDDEVLQFDLQEQAGKDYDTQTKVTQKREKEALANPTYRTTATSTLKGLKERSFKPRYEGEIKTLSRIEGRNAVDTEGNRTVLSRIKTVPANSTAVDVGNQTGDARLIESRTKATMKLRDRIAGILPDTGTNLANVTKLSTAEEKRMLKEQKISTRQFLELHNIFREKDKRFYNHRNFKPMIRLKKGKGKS
jgi:hypothetical protein